MRVTIIDGRKKLMLRWSEETFLSCSFFASFEDPIEEKNQTSKTELY